MITDWAASDWQRSGGIARAFTTGHGYARAARDGTHVTKRSEVDRKNKRDLLRKGVAAEQSAAMTCL